MFMRYQPGMAVGHTYGGKIRLWVQNQRSGTKAPVRAANPADSIPAGRGPGPVTAGLGSTSITNTVSEAWGSNSAYNTGQNRRQSSSQKANTLFVLEVDGDDEELHGLGEYQLHDDDDDDDSGSEADDDDDDEEET
jgi:hypothetical protein